MENIEIIEKIDVVEEIVEKTEIEEIITECFGCRGKDLVHLVDNEHEFSDEVEVHDGYICNDCGCFHFYDGEDFVYEYVYMSDKNKDVKWKINSN